MAAWAGPKIAATAAARGRPCYFPGLGGGILPAAPGRAQQKTGGLEGRPAWTSYFTVDIRAPASPGNPVPAVGAVLGRAPSSPT
jgi:hypothetical protein